jgi:protein SCO1/2
MPSLRWRFIAIILAVLESTALAAARPSPADYQAVGISIPRDAGLPLSATVTDETGNVRPLGALIAQPTVLVFADLTCRTLCGPTVAFVAAALQQSGLRANEQFRLLVISIDPQDSAADAARMRREHLDNSIVGAATDFVTADQRTIEAMTSALGYRYSFDAEAGQYIHPDAAIVLGKDGKVSRVLTGLGLSGEDMRLALVEASEGRSGSFGDRVRLLCSAFDPAHGTYSLVVSRVLGGASIITIVLLGGGIGGLAFVGHRTRDRCAPRQQ